MATMYHGDAPLPQEVVRVGDERGSGVSKRENRRVKKKAAGITLPGLAVTWGGDL